MKKILLGMFLAAAAIFVAAGSGVDSTGNKPISGLDAPKAQAEEEPHGTDIDAVSASERDAIFEAGWTMLL